MPGKYRNTRVATEINVRDVRIYYRLEDLRSQFPPVPFVDAVEIAAVEFGVTVYIVLQSLTRERKRLGITSRRSGK